MDENLSGAVKFLNIEWRAYLPPIDPIPAPGGTGSRPLGVLLVSGVVMERRIAPFDEIGFRCHSTGKAGAVQPGNHGDSAPGTYFDDQSSELIFARQTTWVKQVGQLSRVWGNESCIRSFSRILTLVSSQKPPKVSGRVQLQSPHYIFSFGCGSRFQCLPDMSRSATFGFLCVWRRRFPPPPVAKKLVVPKGLSIIISPWCTCVNSAHLLSSSQPLRLVESVRGPRSRSCGLLESNVDSSNDFPHSPPLSIG